MLAQQKFDKPSVRWVHVGLWFAVIAWGGSFVAARALLAAKPGGVSLSPTILAAARFSIASLFFVAPLVRAVTQRQVSG